MTTQLPRKLGRNQPCWCGSGKKYKHCHLAQDEQGARAIPPPPPHAPPALAPAKRTEPTPQELAAQAEWDDFEQADLDGKVALFLKRVEEKRLDEEATFEMLLAIRELSHPRQNPAARAQFQKLVEQLETALPQVYYAERGFLLECLLKDALAAQDWMQVNERAAQFAELADEKIDTFFEMVDALLYHGQTDKLLEGMKRAWLRVSEAPNVLPSGVQEFFSILLDLNLFHYLGTTPQPRADDPRLTESVRAIGHYNPVWLSVAVPHLAAPAPSAWTRADFGNAVDAETWEQNLVALLYEFMGEQQRAANVPLSRSNMARNVLYQILHQQFVKTALAARPKGKRTVAPLPTSPLIPQYQLLDRTLAGKFDLFGSEPYPAGALMELVPAYLHFLARLGVVHPTEMDQALDELTPLFQPLFKVLDGYGADAHLLQNVKHAWSAETLDARRRDPRLAGARTQPLILPPPSPNPLADAQIYRFKVEYQQAEEVWFILELHRDQTLDDLHFAIQDAADFDQDHLYSFYLSGTAWDKETEYSPGEARYSSHTALKNVPLRLKQHFLYLFDYGDQHMFDVQLIDAHAAAPAQAYPHLVAQHGKMPPQYGDGDEEWNDEEEE